MLRRAEVMMTLEKHKSHMVSSWKKKFPRIGVRTFIKKYVSGKMILLILVWEITLKIT